MPEENEENIKLLNRRVTRNCEQTGRGRIRINVSGLEFKTYASTLERFPDTLLGDRSRRGHYQDPLTGVYYFERNREAFGAILYFYQSRGYIERPTCVSLDNFVEEILFFNLDYYAIPERAKEVDEARHRCGHQLRSNLWLFLENPSMNIYSKFFNILSVMFILVSTVSFCIETLPMFDDSYVNKGTDDEPIWEYDSEILNMKPWDQSLRSYPFWLIETICIIFFTIELILRCCTCPSIRMFFTNSLNLIDIVAIVPYFVTLIIEVAAARKEEEHLRQLVAESTLPSNVTGVPESLTTQNEKEIENMTKNESSISHYSDKVAFLAVMRIIRLLRIIRLAKLSRHSRNLNALVKTITQSVKEFSFLLLFFLVSMVIFSTVIFFLEEETNPDFSSIPASFWWTVVTMTTVGYGDVVPMTVGGKCVGFVCALAGVLCIALPVPSIVQNFRRIYQEDKINPDKKEGDNVYILQDELKKRFVHSNLH